MADFIAKCVGCGQFIGADQLAYSRFDYEPSSHFGPEKADWTCFKCLTADREKAEAA